MLPFTHDAFIDVFRVYNTAIWPAQLVAYLLGATVLLLLLRPTPRASRAVAAVLGLMWLWTGVAYHAVHFSAINRAAYGFAALFVVQGLMLAWTGAAWDLEFRIRGGARGGIGLGHDLLRLVALPRDRCPGQQTPTNQVQPPG